MTNLSSLDKEKNIRPNNNLDLTEEYKYFQQPNEYHYDINAQLPSTFRYEGYQYTMKERRCLKMGMLPHTTGAKSLKNILAKQL